MWRTCHTPFFFTSFVRTVAQLVGLVSMHCVCCNMHQHICELHKCTSFCFQPRTWYHIQSIWYEEEFLLLLLLFFLTNTYTVSLSLTHSHTHKLAHTWLLWVFKHPFTLKMDRKLLRSWYMHTHMHSVCRDNVQRQQLEKSPLLHPSVVIHCFQSCSSVLNKY